MAAFFSVKFSPIFLILTFNSQISGSKVKLRWSGMSKSKNITALVPWSDKGSLSKDTLQKQGVALMDLIFEPFGDWTPVEFTGQKVGEMYPNGSWDGMIGALAQGKGDVMMQFVNPNMFDSRFDIPGHIGPIAADGRLALLSSFQREKVTTTLLGFFDDSVDGEFYFFCFVWTLLFIITYTTFNIFLWKLRIEMKRSRGSNRIQAADEGTKEAISESKAVITTTINCLWLVTEAFVLTEVFTKPKLRIRRTKSLSVLSMALTLCVYYALDLVLWSQLSGELAAERAPLLVDTVSDLINGSGRHMIPATLPDLGTMSNIRDSSNVDDQELYSYIMSFNESLSRVSFDSGNPEPLKISGMIGDVKEGKTAFIFLSTPFSYISHGCFFQPDNMIRMHVSKRTIGSGLMAFFYGPRLDKRMASDLDFRITNLIEMGIYIKGIIQDVVSDFYSHELVAPNLRKGFICQQEMDEKVQYDPNYDPKPIEDFDLATMFQVFSILAAGLTVSTVAIAIEKIVHTQKQNFEEVFHKTEVMMHKVTRITSIVNSFQAFGMLSVLFKNRVRRAGKRLTRKVKPVV